MQYAFTREQSPYTQYAEQHAHTRYNAIFELFSYSHITRYTVSSAIKRQLLSCETSRYRKPLNKNNRDYGRN